MALLEGWYLVIFIILVVFIVMKVINTKQNAATGLALFLFFIIAISMGYFFISNNIEVNDMKSLFDAGALYSSWLFSAVGNVIDITSNAINMDWKGNSTKT